MKPHLILFLFSCSTYSVQGQISIKNNSIRPHDEIIKQQVEYKDPGRTGEDVLWNFAQLKLINKEYKLKYEAPEIKPDSLYILGKDTIWDKGLKDNELVIGIEHKTRYYYRSKNNMLFLLGHENPTTLLHYKEPLQVFDYQMDYQMGFSNSYSSDARYSNRIDLNSQGELSVLADATGKMILPSGETLNNVIRIKTTQTFLEAKKEDSIPIINRKLNMEVETYRWYAKGYRYPIFETIHTINKNEEGEDADYFKTAFFYPPQEHYYLWDDKDNLAVLDSLENAGEQNKTPNHSGGNMDPQFFFAYNCYPNPVENNLSIEYLLENETNVQISLIDMNGRIIKEIQPQKREVGMYFETIDCNSLPKGNYILKLKVNDEFINEKILKK